jgi:transposase InsO family protein
MLGDNLEAIVFWDVEDLNPSVVDLFSDSSAVVGRLTLKYEEVDLKDYRSVAELVSGLTNWFGFYNHERPHQSLTYRTPSQVDQEAGRSSG